VQTVWEERLQVEVQERLRRLFRGQPTHLRNSASRYFREHGRRLVRRRRQDAVNPFWLLAPGWYLTSREQRGILHDLLYAQYCLLLTIRIHDDLLDAQATDSWLILVGDDLLVEAQTVFEQHSRGHAQSIVGSAVRTSLYAIADVDRLQRASRGMPISARGLYADVAAVFSVAAGAALARLNRYDEYRTFRRFASDLSIASQLLDDLADVEEDAAHGRLNVAAAMLIGSPRLAVRCRNQRFRRQLIARRIASEGAAESLLDLTIAHVHRAARTARRLSVSQATEYARAMERECNQLREAMHHTRVDVILGDLARHRVVAGTRPGRVRV